MIDILTKENAALTEQKEYLKKQGDELAITVSNLIIEIKALKEVLKDASKFVFNLGLSLRIDEVLKRGEGE